MSEEQAKELFYNRKLLNEWIDQTIKLEYRDPLDEVRLFIDEIDDDEKAQKNKTKNKTVASASDDDDEYEYNYEASRKAEKSQENSNQPNKETKESQKQNEDLADKYEKYRHQTLYVENLDDSVTGKELESAFSKFGQVKKAKIMRFEDV